MEPSASHIRIPVMEKWLCVRDAADSVEALPSGVDAVFVDWEVNGKAMRQEGFDTSLQAVDLAETLRIRNSTPLPVIVRINPFKAGETEDEVQRALDAGADRLMLANATSVESVEHYLRILDGRAEPGIMIESKALLEQKSELARLPWTFGYIGLNDLMISSGNANIWQAVVDGTVREIFEVFSDRAIGFGGITAVEGGFPVPFKLLAAAMVQQRSRFSMLRRSFFRDVPAAGWLDEIQRVDALFDELRGLAPEGLRVRVLEFERVCLNLARS